MGAPDILTRLAGAGICLSPLPDGRLWAEPRSRLNDELRGLIRQHRAELLAVLIELAAITDWLNQIEERDPAIVAYLLNSCRTDPSARAYFLRHVRGEFLH